MEHYIEPVVLGRVYLREEAQSLAMVREAGRPVSGGWQVDGRVSRPHTGQAKGYGYFIFWTTTSERTVIAAPAANVVSEP